LSIVILLKQKRWRYRSETDHVS